MTKTKKNSYLDYTRKLSVRINRHFRFHRIFSNCLSIRTKTFTVFYRTKVYRVKTVAITNIRWLIKRIFQNKYLPLLDWVSSSPFFFSLFHRTENSKWIDHTRQPNKNKRFFVSAQIDITLIL